jgi:DNA-directed RNA polymerase subunit omega
MARITVEDCLKNIDNQFDLVMTAAKRARRIANGAEALVEIEDDKPTVIALREIAAGLINQDILAEMDEPVEDILSSEEAEELLASTPMPGQDSEAPRAIPPMERTLANPAPEMPAETQPEPAQATDSISDDLLAQAIAAELDAAPLTADAPTESAEPQAEEPAPAPEATPDMSADDAIASLLAEAEALPDVPAEDTPESPASDAADENPEDDENPRV